MPVKFVKGFVTSMRSVCHNFHGRRSVGSYEGRPQSTVTSLLSANACTMDSATFAVAEVSGGKYIFKNRIRIRRLYR